MGIRIDNPQGNIYSWFKETSTFCAWLNTLLWRWNLVFHPKERANTGGVWEDTRR